MVKAIVLYGHPADPVEFEEYYQNTHMPMVGQAAMPRTEAARLVGAADENRPPYYRTFEMWFDTMEQLQQALRSPQGQALADDLRNFATGGATILIAAID